MLDARGNELGSTEKMEGEAEEIIADPDADPDADQAAEDKEASHPLDALTGLQTLYVLLRARVRRAVCRRRSGPAPRRSPPSSPPRRSYLYNNQLQGELPDLTHSEYLTEFKFIGGQNVLLDVSIRPRCLAGVVGRRPALSCHGAHKGPDVVVRVQII